MGDFHKLFVGRENSIDGTDHCVSVINEPTATVFPRCVPSQDLSLRFGVLSVASVRRPLPCGSVRTVDP